MKAKGSLIHHLWLAKGRNGGFERVLAIISGFAGWMRTTYFENLLPHHHDMTPYDNSCSNACRTELAKEGHQFVQVTVAPGIELAKVCS